MPASSYKTASSAASKLILLAAARLVVTVSFKGTLSRYFLPFSTTEEKLIGQRNLILIKKRFLLEVAKMDE